MEEVTRLEARDLRIGNLVFEDYGGVYTVFGIKEKAVTISKSATTVKVDFKYSELKPIPITEEWLLKFGFDKENDLKHPNAPIYFISHPDPKRKELICFLHNCSHAHIKHIHELQNLFKAVIATDLTLHETSQS